MYQDPFSKLMSIERYGTDAQFDANGELLAQAQFFETRFDYSTSGFETQPVYTSVPYGAAAITYNRDMTGNAVESAMTADFTGDGILDRLVMRFEKTIPYQGNTTFYVFPGFIGAQGIVEFDYEAQNPADPNSLPHSRFIWLQKNGVQAEFSYTVPDEPLDNPPPGGVGPLRTEYGDADALAFDTLAPDVDWGFLRMKETSMPRNLGTIDVLVEHAGFHDMDGDGRLDRVAVGNGAARRKLVRMGSADLVGVFQSGRPLRRHPHRVVDAIVPAGDVCSRRLSMDVGGIQHPTVRNVP